MKSTEQFTKIIKQHLEQRAAQDPLFAETFKKEKKNIKDCITYILNTVKASGCNGFSDDEVYNMAVHYYDEDDIKVGAAISNVSIVTNQASKSKQSGAKDKIQQPKPQRTTHVEKNDLVNQMSLF